MRLLAHQRWIALRKASDKVDTTVLTGLVQAQAYLDYPDTLYTAVESSPL